MEIDVNALQQLPELTEFAGLASRRPQRCQWATGTKVICGGGGKTCSKTIVYVIVKSA